MLKKNNNNNKKVLNKITIFFIAFFLISFIVASIFNIRFSREKIVLNGQVLSVLVAKNPMQWYRGLGKRDSLGKYDGMLFLFFSEKRHGIVMRDMRFPIDIVWLNYGEVVDMAQNVPVESVSEEDLMVYFPRKEANMVLEFPAGWVLENRLKIGDKMEIFD